MGRKTYTHMFVLRMTNTMTSLNTDLSSWDILYSIGWLGDMNYGEDLEGGSHVLIDVLFGNLQ
jgi:hypothetical protein